VSRLRPSGLLDWTFEIALVIKGLDGVLEIVGGTLLLFVSKAQLDAWVVALTQHELSEDPNDFVATHLLSAEGGMSGGSLTFAALYLLAHGVVKVVLVAAVLKDRLWAYPWMIGFLVVFIVYQAYLLVVAPTVGIALLTVFDVFVVWLTYREYGKRRLLQATPAH
jgi:uncharacterized membrane protein